MNILKEYGHEQLKRVLHYYYKGFNIVVQHSPASEYENGADVFHIQSVSMPSILVSLDDIIDDTNDRKIIENVLHSFLDTILNRGITGGLIFLYSIYIKKEPVVNKDLVSYQSVIKGKVFCNLTTGLINNTERVDTLTSEHLKFYKNCLFDLLLHIKYNNLTNDLKRIGLTNETYFQYMLSGYSDIPKDYKYYIDNTYSLTLNGY